jgi:hypothetical protein
MKIEMGRVAINGNLFRLVVAVYVDRVFIMDGV